MRNRHRRLLPAMLLAVLIAAFSLPTTSLAAETDDAAAIRSVIEQAYVQGVWVQRDPDLVREGFAPTFVMQLYWNGELSTRTLDQWLERMQLDKQANETPVRAEISVLEIAGDAAVARVELFLDGAHAFTDFMGLYRTADGWKIVNKHFQSHG